MEDAGPQLAKVLEFRKEQEMLKQIFFQEFSDVDDYRRKIFEYLFRYIFKASKPIVQFAEGSSTHAISPLKEDLESIKMHSSDEEKEASMPSQIIELMESVNVSIKNGEFKFPSEKSDFNKNKFNTARFYLIASTWLSKGYSTELLDPHCINILFKYKEILELTPMERDYIFRTIIGNIHNNTAGWFWIDDLDTDNIRDRLFYHAVFDDNEIVRLNSIEILKLAKLRPNDKWKEDFNVFELLLNDKLDSIKKATLSYLTLLGKREDLDLLENLLVREKSSIYNNIILTKLAIIAKEDANSALSQLLQSSRDLIARDAIAGIEKFEINISDALLLNALENDDNYIKIFAAKSLAKRGSLTTDLIDHLLKSSNKELKEICYRELIGLGIKIDIKQMKNDLEDSVLAVKDELLFKAYDKFTNEELERKLDWYEIDGPIAYKILAKREPEKKESVRRDLLDQFKELYERSEERFRSKYGEAGIDIMEPLHKHDEFIRLRFIAAGLSVISEQSYSTDIMIARKYIEENNYDVRMLAVKIIERHGDKSDIESLIKLCKDSYGDLKASSANAALSLSPGVEGAAKYFLNTYDEILIKLALKSIAGEDKTSGDAVEPLLKNENENIRAMVLYYLANRSQKEYLEDLLSRYIGQPIYYYNVVCWLDRILYAKQPIKDVFINKLKQKFD